MMRQLIYDALYALVVSDQLKAIHQGESMLKAPSPRDFPIAVYRIGNETNENLGSGSTAYRKFFQVYVHDVPADYSRIDALIPVIRDALTAAAPSGHVLEVMWRENSRDLNDEYMGSIVRYLRFEAALAQ